MDGDGRIDVQYAFDTHHVLTDVEKMLLSETNGHIIMLRATLSRSLSTNIEENLIFSVGCISPKAFNLMEQRVANRVLSNHLPYPQSHILSREKGLLETNYNHANENRFIRELSTYIDSDAPTRDATQSAHMKRTDVIDRQNDNAPMSHHC